MTPLPLFSTLGEVFAGWAAERPDDPALITPDRTWTSGDLVQLIETQKRALDALAPPGAFIGVNADACAEYVALLYSVPASGRTLVPLNRRLAPGEIVAQLERANVNVVFGDPVDGFTGVVIPIGDLTKPTDRATPQHQLTPAASSPDSVAWVIFTSGSTGAPKGVLITRGSVEAAVANTAQARPLADDDVYLYPFPLFHIAAYNVVHAHVRRRPVVLPSRFDAGTILDLIAAHQVTAISLTATMIRLLLDEIASSPGQVAPSTLRTIAYGAAPLTSTLLREAHDVFGCDFAQGYGMTELSGNAVFLGPDEHRAALAGDDRLLGAAGFAGPGIELRVVDPIGDVVPWGVAGEVLVKGGQVCAGYLNDLAATREAIIDGWLHTGDIGTLHRDGLLRIVDRAKDIVVTGGENVASREVEDALATFPGVKATAVIGTPDDRWGEAVTACVVIDDTARGEFASVEGEGDGRAAITWADEQLLAELQNHVTKSLASYKKPRRVCVLNALPVNASGKVDKVELRRLIASM